MLITAAPIPSAARRITAVAVAETKLLLRNRTALTTALLMAPVLVGTIGAVTLGRLDGQASSSFGVDRIAELLIFGTLFVLLYNLTTIFVARREDGQFQRMATGLVTPWGALIAAALPSVAVLLGQLVMGSAVAFTMFGLPAFPNPIVATLAVLGSACVGVSFAAVCSSFTKSTEAAQYTTIAPLMLLLPGTLPGLPEAADFVAKLTPLRAASDLFSLGLGGTSSLGAASSWGTAAGPLLVLAAWAVALTALARARMQFQRRR